MFHTILRNMREERGISQKDFAKKLGIPVTTYRNYENTQREPNYDILIRIAKLLNVSTDELLGNISKSGKYTSVMSKLAKLPENNYRTAVAFIDFLLSDENTL